MTATAHELLADEARACVAAVPDPELPTVTIADLGVLRGVRFEDGVVHVTITPTYAGCPAMDAIRADIEAAVHEGLPGRPVVVHTELAPPWSSDDITDEGRRKLAAAGIAPPDRGPVGLTLTVRCPQCGSPDTRELTRFGSTACKALWVCDACAEPFDRFKEH
ncbi:MAG TPA: 1,2-phenylacetyl-CoA epoxidase subunit PaaD [Marmoricola sp.]